MNVLLGILLNPRGLGILVAAAITVGWLYYQGLVSDLETARQDLASARANLEIAIGVAEHNAEAAGRRMRTGAAPPPNWRPRTSSSPRRPPPAGKPRPKSGCRLPTATARSPRCSTTCA